MVEAVLEAPLEQHSVLSLFEDLKTQGLKSLVPSPRPSPDHEVDAACSAASGKELLALGWLEVTQRTKNARKSFPLG